MAPKIFWTAKGGWGRAVSIAYKAQSSRLNHNCLDPDMGDQSSLSSFAEAGWCGSIQVEPLTDTIEITGANSLK